MYLSLLFLLFSWIGLSRQQCLKTFKGKNEYTFALAHTNDTQDPAAACYFECGAHIVTRSSNQGDMDQLTLFDNQVSSLLANQFLELDTPYLLNQIGLTDTDGGNGIGCIEMTSTTKIKSYALSDTACIEATMAICGYYGKQLMPKVTSETGNPTKTKPATTKSLPVFTSTPTKNSNHLQFRLDDSVYHVIKKKIKTHDSALRACQNIKKTYLATVRSDTIPVVTTELQKLIDTNQKLVIGSWNGDHYQLSGSQCLVMQLGHGIYPGACSDASFVLCQK